MNHSPDLGAISNCVKALPAGSAPASGRFRPAMQACSRGLALAVGFSIPLSTSLAEILMGLFLAAWVFSGDFSAKWKLIWRNPLARRSGAMFAVLVVGLFYSSGGWREAFNCLLKYREFLYVPMFAVAFDEPRQRIRGVRAFMLGTLLLMSLSYIEYLFGVDWGLASTVGQGPVASAGYVTFKDRIVHNLLVSLLVYLLADEFLRASRWRWLYGAAIVLAVVNIFCLVQGRTGYLVSGVLTVLFLMQRFQFRGAVYAGLVMAAAGGGGYALSPVIQARVDATVVQIQNHFGSEKKRSPDPRLEFYETTLALVARHPLWGTGTGSFEGQYRTEAGRTGAPVTDDPHCEYLLLAVQTGLIGVALFVSLLWSLGRSARRLPPAEAAAARGAAAALAAGCLFNSLILSFTGGLLFGYFTGLAAGGLVDLGRMTGAASPGPIATDLAPGLSVERTRAA